MVKQTKSRTERLVKATNSVLATEGINLEPIDAVSANATEKIPYTTLVVGRFYTTEQSGRKLKITNIYVDLRLNDPTVVIQYSFETADGRKENKISKLILEIFLEMLYN